MMLGYTQYISISTIIIVTKDFFHSQSESQPKCEVHLFPFLNDDGDLACFYKRICHTMMNVSKNEENQDSVDALIKLAKERFVAK